MHLGASTPRVVAPWTQRTAEETRADQLALLALGACLVLALGLRLWGLGVPSFWVDEIASRSFAGLAWADLLGPVARVETNPPGHYALLKGVLALGGDGEVALRLPSALAGGLAALPIGLLAWRAGGPLAGVLAAALLAVSVAQLDQSQQARGYALLFLALATALWLTGPMLAGRRRALAGAGFVLACLAALYLHATAVVMVAALFAHALTVLAVRAGGLPPRREILRLVVAGLAILAGAAWWLALAAAMTAEGAATVAWIARPDLADSAGILANVLGGSHLGRLRWVAAGLAVALLAAGAALAWHRRAAEPLGWLAGFVLGVAALHGLSQVRPIMLERTALALLVFALPLTAWALAAIRPRALGLGLAALLLLLSLRGVASRAEHLAAQHHGEDWRGAVASLAARAAPGDIVLLGSAPEISAVALYAPEAAARLRHRVMPGPADRLEPAILAASGMGGFLDPAEACGTTLWALALDLEDWPRFRALRLPPGEDAAFGRVGLRRIALPPCPG